MDRQNLEFYLNRGNEFGYNTKIDEVSIAWVILSKRFPNKRFFELFEEKDNPLLYREQMNIKNKPYRVWIAELCNNVYDGERFPIDEDYLTNTNFAFSTLDEVEKFLLELGLNLADIKWSSEIGFL